MNIFSHLAIEEEFRSRAHNKWPLDNGSLATNEAMRSYTTEEAMKLIISSIYGNDIFCDDTQHGPWRAERLLSEIVLHHDYLHDKPLTKQVAWFERDYSIQDESGKKLLTVLIKECSVFYIAKILWDHYYGNARIHFKFSLNQIASVFLEMQQSKTTNDSAIAFAKENADEFQKFYQKLFDGTQDNGDSYENRFISKFIHSADCEEFINYGFCLDGEQKPRGRDGYGIMRSFEHCMTSGKSSP